MLYALSDPTRLDIVKALCETKEKACGEFKLHAKSTLSHHFKVLREAGVTRTRMEGRNRYTSLRREGPRRKIPRAHRSCVRSSFDHFRP